MPRQFTAVLIVVAILVLLAFTMRLDLKTPASPQEITVNSRTKGYEGLKADLVDNQVRIRLQNNHKETITAFAISFGGATVKEDFAYSEVHFGIEPGETFEESYPFSRSSPGAEPPTLRLLAVLLKDGTADGDSIVVQQMKDQRLGEKIQIHRLLKILEKEAFSRKDLKALKGEITVAFNAGESEARIIRKELLPASRIDDNLSEALKNGLHWGREKMLRRFQELEQLPGEQQEKGFIELMDRAQRLFAKL